MGMERCLDTWAWVNTGKNEGGVSVTPSVDGMAQGELVRGDE